MQSQTSTQSRGSETNVVNIMLKPTVFKKALEGVSYIGLFQV